MDQQPEPCIFYLERWMNVQQTRFLITAIAAGILVVVVNRIFSGFLKYLPWDISTISIALAMGLCLSLQLIGIPWYLVRMKEAFLEIKDDQKEPIRDFYLLLQKRLCEKIPLIATIAFVFLPFICINVLSFLDLSTTPFFYWERTVIAFSFDVVNYLFGYFLLYLFAVILWMLLVAGWSLHDAEWMMERNKIPLDILAPDGIGGLGAVQALLRSLFTYYFVIVALLIVSYIHPTKIWSCEALVVVMFFLAGILFFLFGLCSIRNIIRRRIAEEISSLNERIHPRYDRLKEIVLDGDETNTDLLKKEQSILDACYSERDRLMILYAKNPAFDTRTIAQSVASVILPVLALIIQLQSVANVIDKIL